MYICISKIYKYNNEEIWSACLIFYGYLSELPLYMIFFLKYLIVLTYTVTIVIPR